MRQNNNWKPVEREGHRNEPGKTPPEPEVKAERSEPMKGRTEQVLVTREGKVSGRPKGGGTDLRTRRFEEEEVESVLVMLTLQGFGGRWKWPSGSWKCWPGGWK